IEPRGNRVRTCNLSVSWRVGTIRIVIATSIKQRGVEGAISRCVGVKVTVHRVVDASQLPSGSVLNKNGTPGITTRQVRFIGQTVLVEGCVDCVIGTGREI